MKVELIGNKQSQEQGSSILEVLIALAVLTLGISAVIMLVFANQSLKLDSETAGEALYKAKDILEDKRALSHQDFNSVVPISFPLDSIYSKEFAVADLTPCRKEVTSRVTWSTEPNRPQKIELKTNLTDIPGALALGGDCATEPPGSNWDNPQRFATDTLSPGKSTAIDVLNRIAYLGQDKSPFLAIADTRSAALGQSSGLFVTFSNGFDTGAQINAVDAAKWINPVTGAAVFYAYGAMNTSTSQLKVIDVTDINNPVLAAARSLSACVAGSYPQGWKLFYYKNRLYVTTRYTAGPEFHIFDVTTPTNPIEIGSGACKGIDLGDTVNDIAVQDQVIDGTTRRFVYFATDESDKELRVFEVTGDVASEITAANQDLPGIQNGESVYIVGNKLYFGRASTPGGPDFYVFDIKNPLSGLTQLGYQDIDTGVIGIRVAGRFAFFVTNKSKAEFQVWDISNFSNITNIKKYNFGNIIAGGIDYEPDFIYATGDATPNFQILYSP